MRLLAEAVWKELEWSDNLMLAIAAFIIILIIIAAIDSFISFRRNRSKRKNVE